MWCCGASHGVRCHALPVTHILRVQSARCPPGPPRHRPAWTVGHGCPRITPCIAKQWHPHARVAMYRNNGRSPQTAPTVQAGRCHGGPGWAVRASRSRDLSRPDLWVTGRSCHRTPGTPFSLPSCSKLLSPSHEYPRQASRPSRLPDPRYENPLVAPPPRLRLRRRLARRERVAFFSGDHRKPATSRHHDPRFRWPASAPRESSSKRWAEKLGETDAGELHATFKDIPAKSRGAALDALAGRAGQPRARGEDAALPQLVRCPRPRRMRMPPRPGPPRRATPRRASWRWAAWLRSLVAKDTRRAYECLGRPRALQERHLGLALVEHDVRAFLQEALKQGPAALAGAVEEAAGIRR